MTWYGWVVSFEAKHSIAQATTSFFENSIALVYGLDLVHHQAKNYCELPLHLLLSFVVIAVVRLDLRLIYGHNSHLLGIGFQRP